jgi:hypothetical protein
MRYRITDGSPHFTGRNHMETINVLDGWEDLVSVAREEIRYSLEDNDIVLTDAELDAAAGSWQQDGFGQP